MRSLDHLSRRDRAIVAELEALLKEGEQLINLVCWPANQDEPLSEGFKQWVEKDLARLQAKGEVLEKIIEKE